MKKLFIIPLFVASLGYAQKNKPDSVDLYKKRVLENTEVDFLTSYYTQEGNNASVTGGIGTEKLSDFTPTIVVSIPLTDDNVLTIDAGISAYTSASSSNLDPFDSSGASMGYNDDDDDDDDDENEGSRGTGATTGSPWVESSGASRQDTWSNVSASYSHSSNDRNNIFSANIGYAREYDYSSLGFGGSFTKLFNEKNTELNLAAKVYLDTWNPVYPTELDSYVEAGRNLNNGFFSGIPILDQNGNEINKNSSNVWSPARMTLIENKKRNTYSASFSFSQILSRNAQFSIFLDLIQQKGGLSNPTQRVYFADKANYYIGNASSIPNYDSPNNRDVFQLADDIERLPDSRFKIPIGVRFNYFINEIFVLRSYYRYYTDDWGVISHTANFELPIKLLNKIAIIPSYRYYTQTAADYFAPYEQNLSTQEFYTSDYDLSAFNSNQFGIGIRYTDIFTQLRLGKLGLKSIDLKYGQYERSTGLSSNIMSFGVKFVMD